MINHLFLITFLFFTSGFANEGRLRLQENSAAAKVEMSEGRLRNSEVTGTTTSTALAPSSEARHRLKEGTVIKPFQTTAVEIPRKPSSAQQVASSVPNVGATRKTEDLSSSLRKPNSKLLMNENSGKTQHTKQNPFGGDDYDETKNPFADEEPSNPFEEDDDYNDSLNPFAE